MFFYFFIFSDLGKVANKQHKTKPLLSCFRLNAGRMTPMDFMHVLTETLEPPQTKL